MSVLIKGMEMPKNCCEFRLLSGFECRALFKDITDFSVADECPLVPVTPHGRLIDADALETKFVHGRWEEAYISETELMNVPTIDAVPVVRCKDCVHCSDDWNGNQPMFTCELGMCGESVQPNDFCSYGERRSE